MVTDDERAQLEYFWNAAKRRYARDPKIGYVRMSHPTKPRMDFRVWGDLTLEEVIAAYDAAKAE